MGGGDKVDPGQLETALAGSLSLGGGPERRNAKAKEEQRMETVKVDIRKLQLLNDRVNQCIDALNQVRLSTHGLSHTPGFMPGAPMGGYPQAQTLGLGYSPFGQISASPGFIPGFSHTSPFGLTASPTTFVPGLAAQLPLQAFGVNPQAFGVNPLLGLAHTSPDLFETYRVPIWADPLLASKLAQTFPYAQAVIPPVVSIY
jgi:hypothetical protein